MALLLIDSLNLYNTIFTDPISLDCPMVSTEHWSTAYDQLQDICSIHTTRNKTDISLQKISSILLRNPEDIFLAWLVACFVPWARISPEPLSKTTTRRRPSRASVAAREGIKADNKICKIVDECATKLERVIALKHSATQMNEEVMTGSKRKSSNIGRDIQGQALRGWGSHWRSTIMFALLTEISEAPTPEARQELLYQYSTWVAELRTLKLMDVDSLKPLVNGSQISKALGADKGGPWMKKAMDIAMEWQLRNPEETDPAGGIEEVVNRKKELGFS